MSLSRVLLMAAMLASSCNRSSLPGGASADLSVDAAEIERADMAVAACPNLPPSCDVSGRCMTLGLTCSAPPPQQGAEAQACICGIGGRFYCNDCRCGTSPVGKCADPRLYCLYDFESSCFCVFPEQEWVCCGGVGTPCPNAPPQDGSPCGCLQVDRCAYPRSTCTCNSGNHWHCSVPDGGAAGDGG